MSIWLVQCASGELYVFTAPDLHYARVKFNKFADEAGIDDEGSEPVEIVPTETPTEVEFL